MEPVSIKGRKVPLKTYFEDTFIAKFTFSVPSHFNVSCSHAILFTDIIGSSQIYHDKGNWFGLLMASQKYEIAASLSHNEAFFGHIKIIKSMGDALFIVCESATIAFQYSIEFIQSIRENSSRTELPIRIRSTLHYGSFLIYTPRFQETVDCFGESINNAARLEGENKRLISENHASDSWSHYPLLLSEEFYSELSKGRELPDECIEPHKVKIREYHGKDLLAYLVNCSDEKFHEQ